MDGLDIRGISLHDLRREVILVDQSPYLFNDTIASNIAFACDAGREEIESAARSADWMALQRASRRLRNPDR